MKIGFTVGCWDVLHDGHRNHLNIVVKDCDLLVVGIVTDWLVKMQKGCNPHETYEVREQKLKDFLNGFNFKTIPIDSLIQPWIFNLIDVAFVGEDQIDRFYAHSKNKVKQKIIIERTPDISSTLIRDTLKASQVESP
jgi:cytidyltransferase-like protein